MNVWNRYEDDDLSGQKINARPAMNSSTIFDLGPPEANKTERAAWLKEYGGPRRLFLESVTASEFNERDPKRYVFELPPGIKLVPHQGG